MLPVHRTHSAPRPPIPPASLSSSSSRERVVTSCPTEMPAARQRDGDGEVEKNGRGEASDGRQHHVTPTSNVGHHGHPAPPTTTLPPRHESDAHPDPTPRKPPSALANLDAALAHAATLSLLTFATLWGVLTRLGLVALNTYDGQSVFAVVWAQGFGCFVMGWATKNRKALERYPPLYVAITTGYCGSVTTFSTWVLDVFRAFGNQHHFDRHGLHNVMDALSQTAVTLSVSLACLAAGKAFARVLDVQRLLRLLPRGRHSRHDDVVASSKPSSSHAAIPARVAAASEPGRAPRRRLPPRRRRRRLWLDVASVALGVGFWIGSALLCALYPPWRRVTFALVLGPPGTWLRWYLSRLNALHLRPFPESAPLPIGTLAANLVATLVLCASFVAQRVGGGGGTADVYGVRGTTACEALGGGLQDGFCACLSTISTLAAELQRLRPRRWGAAYVGLSWCSGVVACVVVVGSAWWSSGMDGSCVGVTIAHGS